MKGSRKYNAEKVITEIKNFISRFLIKNFEKKDKKNNITKTINSKKNKFMYLIFKKLQLIYNRIFCIKIWATKSWHAKPKPPKLKPPR